MGHQFTCACGWMLITQDGEEDLKMHVRIHMADAHPDRPMTDAEVQKAIRVV